MNITTVDIYGLTPIHVAAYKGQLKVINTKVFASIWTHVVQAVKFLLDKGADVNKVSTSGASVLHWATLSRSKEVVELLIHRGANVESVDKQAQTYVCNFYS